MPIRTIIALAFTCLAASACAAGPPIVIDGEFDDWSDVDTAQSDPADAPGAFIDFRNIRATADSQFVHLQVDFGNVVNIQKLPGSAYIFFDADGNPRTGRTMYGLEGVDIAVVLTAPNARNPDRDGAGVAVESATFKPGPEHAHKPTGMISPYAVGFTFGPTYASQTYELRIERGVQIPKTPQLFTGDSFGVALVAFDQDRNLLDETTPLRVELPRLDRNGEGADESVTLDRADDTDFRLVSWNVEFSALLRNPQHFVPILRALKPDIILLQELDEKTTTAQLTQFVNQHLRTSSDQRWTALVAPGGGNLHSGIATHLPMRTIEPLMRLPYRDRPDYTTRHGSALIRAGGRNILATSIHLRCCGSMNSREEEIRLMEVDIIGDALRAVFNDNRDDIDAMLIAGDFNLVGSRTPLDNMVESLDVDQSDLSIAQPLQLDQRTNATWSDPDQPFVPGRLDYVLYSDATVHPVRSFVVDARDLPKRQRRALGITAESTARASDHLPVVVDFAWNPSNRTEK